MRAALAVRNASEVFLNPTRSLFVGVSGARTVVVHSYNTTVRTRLSAAHYTTSNNNNNNNNNDNNKDKPVSKDDSKKKQPGTAKPEPKFASRKFLSETMKVIKANPDNTLLDLDKEDLTVEFLRKRQDEIEESLGTNLDMLNVDEASTMFKEKPSRTEEAAINKVKQAYKAAVGAGVGAAPKSPSTAVVPTTAIATATTTAGSSYRSKRDAANKEIERADAIRDEAIRKHEAENLVDLTVKETDSDKPLLTPDVPPERLEDRIIQIDANEARRLATVIGNARKDEEASEKYFAEKEASGEKERTYDEIMKPVLSQWDEEQVVPQEPPRAIAARVDDGPKRGLLYEAVPVSTKSAMLAPLDLARLPPNTTADQMVEYFKLYPRKMQRWVENILTLKGRYDVTGNWESLPAAVLQEQEWWEGKPTAPHTSTALETRSFVTLSEADRRAALAPDLAGQYRFGVLPEETVGLDPKVRDFLSFAKGNPSRGEINEFRVQRAIKRWARHPTDTGSTAVQIAVLSERIRALQDYLDWNKQDKHNKRTLAIMVSKRESLLRYLKKNDVPVFYDLLRELNMRDLNPVHNAKYVAPLERLRARLEIQLRKKSKWTDRAQIHAQQAQAQSQAPAQAQAQARK